MAVRAVGFNLERSWRDERERQLCPRPPGELLHLRWEAEKTCGDGGETMWSGLGTVVVLTSGRHVRVKGCFD